MAGVRDNVQLWGRSFHGSGWEPLLWREDRSQDGEPTVAGSRRSMTTHIKLYGGKAELFEDIKEDLTEELGYEPTNPEVLGALMANYNTIEQRQ